MRLRSGSNLDASLPHSAKRCLEDQAPSQEQPIPKRPRVTGGPASSQEPKRARLTIQNLTQHTKAIIKKTGPKGKRSASPDPEPSLKSDGSKKSKNTSTTDSKFGEELHDRHVLDRYESDQPNDSVHVRAFLDRERPSLVPTEHMFRRYCYQLKVANVETEVHVNAFKILAAYSETMDGYKTSFDISWNEVTSNLTGGLSAPKPDMFESYITQEYPASSRAALNSALRPSKHPVAIPSACVEFRGPDGSMNNAREQCAYNGAVMVDCMKTIHEYLGKPLDKFYGTTQALTMAFDGNNVEIYAHHAVESGDSILYHQAAVSVHFPAFSLETFQKAYQHVNNTLDWARDRATKTLNDLKAHEIALEKARQNALQTARSESATPKALAIVCDAPISPPGTHLGTEEISLSAVDAAVVRQDTGSLRIEPAVTGGNVYDEPRTMLYA